MSGSKRTGAIAPTLRRWVVYRQYQDESRQLIDYIEDLEELADLIRSGSDWERLFHIRIELNQLRRAI